MRRGGRRLAGIILVLAAAFLLAAPFAFKPYGIFILSMWAVMTIAAIGLNPVSYTHLTLPTNREV